MTAPELYGKIATRSPEFIRSTLLDGPRRAIIHCGCRHFRTRMVTVPEAHVNKSVGTFFPAAEAGVAGPAPRGSTASLPAGAAGHRYALRRRASGGSLPYRWSLSGRLPLGLHMHPTGVLDGTPRRADRGGVYTLVVRVIDADGQTATRKLLLRLRR